MSDDMAISRKDIKEKRSQSCLPNGMNAIFGKDFSTITLGIHNGFGVPVRNIKPDASGRPFDSCWTHLGATTLLARNAR